MTPEELSAIIDRWEGEKVALLLAHPAGVEPATLSTANCASRFTGTDCNK